MTNSRQKGARGERLWADTLTNFGYPARRGQQFCGTGDSPDVVCESLPFFHPEVKNTERLNLEDWLFKATQEADGRLPYVAHKKNRKPWLVTMYAEDWIALLSYADIEEMADRFGRGIL
jgi:Holliday junction resolvase